MKKSKWNVLYVILAGVVIFALMGAPAIAVSVVNETIGRTVTAEIQ